MAQIEEIDGKYIVTWETFAGDKFTGELIEMDNGTGIIKLPDGTKKAINLEGYFEE